MGLLGTVALFTANARSTATGYTLTSGRGAATGARDTAAGVAMVSVFGSGASTAAPSIASATAAGSIMGAGATVTDAPTGYAGNSIAASAAVISPSAASIAHGKAYNQRKRRARPVVFSFRMQK